MNKQNEKANKDLMDKIERVMTQTNNGLTAPVQPQKSKLRKSMSMKPAGVKTKSDKKKKDNNGVDKSDLGQYQQQLRSISNDIKQFRSSKTIYGKPKNKRRVKFRSKLTDTVEIESFKPYFMDESVEEEEDNTREIPQAPKKQATKQEDQPLVNKPFNHKLNSTNENKAKCCVCIVF